MMPTGARHAPQWEPPRRSEHLARNDRPSLFHVDVFATGPLTKTAQRCSWARMTGLRQSCG
jgi:hypothetical protein